MKKYTILFALLVAIILLAFEVFPQVMVSAQNPCGNGRGQKPCPPVPGNPGNPGNPGPKNKKPTLVPSAVPTSTPTLIPPPHPYPYPYPYPGGHTPTPTPVPGGLPHIPDQNLCKIGPCWPFGFLNPGDPVEYLAGGGLIVFLVILGFVFFRGGNKPGGGAGGNSIR